MQFTSEHLLSDGRTLKYIVLCGIPPGEQSFTTAEGLYIKQPNDADFKIAVPMVPQYLKDNRMSEIMALRAKLVEPYLIEGTRKTLLPFQTTLRLRSEAWLKAEPFLQEINAGGLLDEKT